MYNAARVLFLAFFNICLFKKRPQDIPASTGLLTVVVLTYIVVATLLLALTEGVGRALLSALVELGVLMLFVLFLLKLTGETSRWTQTLTALAGSGVVLSILALPAYLIMAQYGNPNAQENPVSGLGLMVLAVLALWNIAVMAHILRNALETGAFTSVMLSVSYIWIILYISSSLLPAELA